MDKYFSIKYFLNTLSKYLKFQNEAHVCLHLNEMAQVVVGTKSL